MKDEAMKAYGLEHKGSPSAHDRAEHTWSGFGNLTGFDATDGQYIRAITLISLQYLAHW
jgi:hypothetical protein